MFLEPPTDGSQTPNYFAFLQQFVTAVRNAENALSVPAASQLSTTFMDNAWLVPHRIHPRRDTDKSLATRQWQNPSGNPAYAANGGNAYDSHLYYSFGAVSRMYYVCKLEVINLVCLSPAVPAAA